MRCLHGRWRRDSGKGGQYGSGSRLAARASSARRAPAVCAASAATAARSAPISGTIEGARAKGASNLVERRGRLDAIAAVRLGAVERPVGNLQQRVDVGLGIHAERDADAHGRRQIAVRETRRRRRRSSGAPDRRRQTPRRDRRPRSSEANSSPPMRPNSTSAPSVEVAAGQRSAAPGRRPRDPCGH